MIQEIKFKDEASIELIKGVNTIANAVKSTFGPNGRNVIIESQLEGDSPHITKDGVTVARSITLENKYQNIGANLVKDVSLKTCKDVGDGTTTSAILTQFIINEGIKLTNLGINAFSIKRGMEKAVDYIVDNLKKSSRLAEDNWSIKSIAMVSTNGDEELSNILTNIFHDIGADGIVKVFDSKSTETREKLIDGIQFKSGYLSQRFSPVNPVLSWGTSNIVVSTVRIENIQQILPALDKLQLKGAPILILAPDFNQSVVDAIINNNERGKLNACLVRGPGYNENQITRLHDLGIMVDSNEPINSIYVGASKSVVITDENTTIVGGRGNVDKINGRLIYLREQILLQKDEYIREMLEERLAQISSKVAELYVGGLSEVEVAEKKDRIDDAIHAIKASMKEGITIGSGLALLRATIGLDKLKVDSQEEYHGINLIKHACQEPIKHLLQSVSEDTSKVSTLLGMDGNMGYNLITKEYEDFYKAGIIDPVKVIYTTIQNASSVGGLVLTTNCVIINKNM